MTEEKEEQAKALMLAMTSVLELKQFRAISGGVVLAATSRLLATMAVTAGVPLLDVFGEILKFHALIAEDQRQDEVFLKQLLN